MNAVHLAFTLNFKKQLNQILIAARNRFPSVRLKPLGQSSVWDELNESE
jgi:hypothetical protein